MKINLTQVYFTHKSSTCFAYDGKPLSMYSNYQDALASANYTNSSLVPYRCEKCGYYHLKPEAFYCEKVSRNCHCVDSNGQIKATYKTEADALKMVKLRGTTVKNITIYACPEGAGYHLTSHAY